MEALNLASREAGSQGLGQKRSLWSFVCLFFETGSHYEAQDGLELVNLLPQPSQCWDYRPCISTSNIKGLLN
jgi:hypothetical protein